MYTFQYVSDLHLECRDDDFLFEIKRNAPYLILAGDIGDPHKPNYTNFLKCVSDLFDEVFLISGNHEYYNNQGRTIDETDEHILNICKFCFTNVHFLQNTSYAIPNSDIIIFGATFWTKTDPEYFYILARDVNDYKCIPKFTIKMCNNLHTQSVNKLQLLCEQQSSPNKKFVVISHHLPHTSLINPKYDDSPLNSSYASDIDIIQNEKRIVASVYGHTHIPNVSGKYYVNPHGYSNQNSSNTIKTATFSI